MHIFGNSNRHLGYEISKDGIMPGTQNIKPVIDFKMPNDVHEYVNLWDSQVISVNL